MSNIVKNLIKILVSSIVMLSISLLVWWLAFDFKMDFTSVSDSLFAVSAIVFIVSLGINIGSGMLFTPFTYTFRLFFARKKLKDEFPTYQDYVDYKKSRRFTAWFLTIESGVILAIALVFALISMR